LGGDGGKSEESAWKMERQVYFNGKKTFLDKICVIISPLILFVVV